MEQINKEWLQELKVGDKVAIYNRRWSIGVVSHATPKRVTVNALIFTRETGEQYGGNGFNFGRIKPLTQDFVDEQKKHVRRVKALNGFRQINADKLTTEQLEAILAIANNEVPK